MARKFLTALDLAKNELQNAVVQNVASAPAAPVKGQIYFDSTTNILYWYSGTAWVPAQGGVVSYGTITAEQSFGASKADGVSTNVARADHAHGNPTHVDADHAAIHLNALATATANYNMGGFKITNHGTPTAGTDAVNKSYVDNLSAGLSWKDSVRAATTANISNFLTNGPFDGITLAEAERLLVKNQTNPAQNGIYYYDSGGPLLTRALDADTGAEMVSASVFVEEGTIQADTAWTCTTNAPITVGTTGLTFVQFAGGGAVTAGAGMTQSGNVLNVIGDATVTVGADVLGVADNGVSNAKLADMANATMKGRRTAGTGDPEDVTMFDLSLMLSTYVSLKYSVLVGGATSVVVTHNLNTRDVVVDVYRAATPWDTVECDVERTSTTTITLRFAVAPAASEYRCVVMG